MKIFLVILAAGIAAGSFSISYKPDREYRYKYETQTVTGVPHHSTEIAGVMIKTTVKIQIKNDNRATLKLEDVTLHKVLTSLETKWPTDGVLPDEVFTTIDERTTDEMITELTKPIKFTYESGSVENVKMDPDEAIWSVNIKKGLLSILKMKLNEEDEWKIEDRLMHKWKMSKSAELYEDVMTDRDSKIFKTMESDVTGICETLYAITKDEHTSTVKVTKTKNYKSCTNEPVFEQGVLSGLTITPENIHEHVVEKSTQANYDIAGTPEEFVITGIRQDSRFIFTPISMERGSAVTTIIQLLTLEDTKEISHSIESDMTLRPRDNDLLYEFPTTPFDKTRVLEMESDTRSFEEDEERRSYRGEDTMTAIDTILEEVVRSFSPVTITTVEKTELVAKLLKKLTVEELIVMCKKYITKARRDNTPSLTKKGEILLDLIPQVTTPKSVKVMAHLITNRLISTTRAVISMKLVSVSITPSFEIVDLLMPTNPEFMASEAVREKRTLKHAMHVTVPLIINRLVKHSKNTLASTRHVNSIVTKFTESMQTAFKSCDDEIDRIAMIKGMGNSGLVSMIPLLADIILDKTESERTRCVATSALTHMPKSSSPRIQKILTTVYMDLTEKSLIRKKAFMSLIDEKPGPAILTIITATQRKEKNIDVGSFVYSYMYSLANAKLPGLRTLADNIRKHLPLLRVVAPGAITKSKAIHIDYMSKLADTGLAVEMLKFNGKNPVIPSLFITRTMVHVFGKSIPFVEAIVYNEGIETVFDNTIGVHSRYIKSMDKKSLKDLISIILHPLQSGRVEFGSVVDEIEDIIEKLGIMDRININKMNLGLGLRLLGKDITFLSITVDDVMEWIETGKLPIIGDLQKYVRESGSTGVTIDILKTHHIDTSTLQLPSPSGLPISLNFTATTGVGITGDISSTIRGSVETYVKPSVGWKWDATFGVDCALIKTGVAVEGRMHSKADVKINTRINPETKKLTVIVESPRNEEYAAMNFKIKPVAFVTTIQTNKEIEPTVTDVIPLTHPTRVQLVGTIIPVTMPIINTKLTTKWVTPVNEPAWMPNSLIWAPSEMDFFFTPIRDNRPVVTEINLDVASTTSQVKTNLPVDVELHEILETSDHAKSVTIAVKVGTEDSEESKVKAVISLATSECMTKYQFNTIIEAPRVLREPIKLEIVSNVRAFIAREFEDMPLNTLVSDLKLAYGTKSMIVKIFKDTPITWNMYTKNNFNNLIEYITGEEVTNTMIKSVAMSPNAMSYRFETECNNDDVDFTNEKYISVAVLGYTYLKYFFPTIPITHAARIENTPSSYEGKITVVPEFQKIIIDVRTPHGMSYAIAVPAFLYTPESKLISLETPMKESEYLPESYSHPWRNERYMSDREFSFRLSGTCSVHRTSNSEVDSIRTLDRVSYSIPTLPESCELLLAKDCSPYKLFAVIMKTEESSKILKILIPHHKIELKPHKSWLSSSGVKLIVDGDEIEVHEERSKSLTEDDRESTFATTWKDGKWTTVDIVKYGLAVSTDGKEVVIEAHSTYRGVMCGMCGNFDADSSNDYEGPDMYVTPSVETLISRYVIPSGSCSAESVRSHYGLEDISNEDCTPIERTIVVERGPETCFSIEPVKMCPRHCRPEITSTRRTTEPFHCRNTDNETTRRLLDDSEIRVLDEIANRRTNADVRVTVPRRCVPKY